MIYRYRAEILDQLAKFAIFPTSHTDPVIVRNYLKALYTMEIRTMRVAEQRKERAGDSSGRKDYARRVIELRDYYSVLTVPVEWWTEK